MRSLDQKWMDHLVLVRHGESFRNVRKRVALAAGALKFHEGIRDMDVTLTAKGKRQAEATGQYLAQHFRYDRVYASPYVRTMQTARLMMKQFAYRAELTLEERIREKKFGALDGLTKSGIAKKYPEELQRREGVGKYYYRPPGGESYPDVALRVHSFIGTLVRECASQSVLVVCHSVVVIAFRRLLERLTQKEMLAIDRDPEQDVCNCSLTWYAFDRSAGARGRLALREFNGVHYPAQYASTEEWHNRARS